MPFPTPRKHNETKEDKRKAPVITTRRQLVSRSLNRFKFHLSGILSHYVTMEKILTVFEMDAYELNLNDLLEHYGEWRALLKDLDEIARKLQDTALADFDEIQTRHIDAIVDSINYEINQCKVGVTITPWDSEVPVFTRRMNRTKLEKASRLRKIQKLNKGKNDE